MQNSQYTVGLGEEGRVSSKIMRPPGGASTIFSSADSPSTPRQRSTNYKMASSFELGDEQPTHVPQVNRRRSKPSVNPLTGELVGSFSSPGNSTGNSSPDLARKDSESNSLKSGSNESVNTVDSGSVASDNSHRELLANATQSATPMKNRVPPGGYSSPLW